MLHTSRVPERAPAGDEGADPAVRLQQFGEWRLEWEPGSRFEYHGGLGPLGAGRAHRAPRRRRLPRLRRSARHARRSGSRVCSASPTTDTTSASPLLPVGERIVELDAFAAGDRTSRPYAPRGDPRRRRVHDGRRARRASTRRCCTTRRQIWDDDVLRDVKTNVRCNFDDPLMGAPVQPHARTRARGRRRQAHAALRDLRCATARPGRSAMRARTRRSRGPTPRAASRSSTSAMRSTAT